MTEDAADVPPRRMEDEMEEKPQDKPAEETTDPGTAAKRKHDAEVVDLQSRVDAAKRSPAPKTSEAPPTPQELSFIDRLRKIKQYGRDALFLNLLLGRQVQSHDLVNGVYGIIEHQHAQDRFLQEAMAQTSKEQTRIRATIDDAVKSASEEDDGLRERLVNLERIGRDRYVEIQERLDYLEELVRRLFAFLCDDRAWQDTPRFRRWGEIRPAAPLVPTLEQYLDGHVRSEDLPERLQKAADSLVGLAVRVATASAAGDEERQPLPPSEPIEPGTPSYDAFEQRLADGVEASKINQEAVDRSKNEIRQAVEDGLAKADEKKRSGGVSS